MGVDSVVLACSYNHEYRGTDLFGKIATEATGERQRGRQYNNHYLYRHGDDVKFLWQLQGVPLAGYALISAMRSNARRIAIVGNKNILALASAFHDEYKSELREREFTFAYEGDTPSMSGTIRAGVNALRLAEDEPYGLVCGDIPLFSDYNALLDDDSIDNSDVVLDLNGFENIFKGQEWPGHFPRYYHWKLDGVQIKEPNCYLLRNTKRLNDVIEDIYATRKSGRSGGFASLLLRRLATKLPVAIPYMLWNEGRNLRRLTMHYLTSFNGGFDKKVADWKGEHMSWLLSTLSGARVSMRATHKDPGRIEDVDSVEDFALLGAMTATDPFLYPHYTDLRRFREDVMPRIDVGNAIFKKFSAYANDWCWKLGINPIFDGDVHIASVEHVFPQLTPAMVDAGVKAHKQLVRNSRQRSVPRVI